MLLIIFHYLKKRKMVSSCPLWCLWKEKNDGSFENRERSSAELESFFFFYCLLHLSLHHLFFLFSLLRFFIYGHMWHDDITFDTCDIISLVLCG